MSKPANFELNQRAHHHEIDVLSMAGVFGGINALANLTEAISLNHGFGQKFQKYVDLLGFDEAIDIFVCKATTLQTSEVSETVEEARLEDRSFEHMIEEQADVVIRCINLMNLLVREGKERGILDPGVTIGTIIKEKTVKNIDRPFAHGGKRF